MEDAVTLLHPDKAVVDMHTTFYAEYLEQLGLWDFNITAKTLGNPERTEGVTHMTRPVLQALKADFYSAEGNFLAAHALLQEAIYQAESRFYRLPSEAKANVLGFVLFEKGVFENRLEHHEAAHAYFQHAYKLANPGPLKAMAEIERFAYTIKPNRKAAYAKLEQKVVDLSEMGMTAYATLALHRLGTLADIAEKYKVSAAYYNRALTQAKEHGYAFLTWQIQNTQGYSALLQKHADQARDILEKVSNTTPSHHMKALALENLALLFFNSEQYPAAAEYVEQALEISRKNQVVSRLAPEYHFLGDVHKDYLGEPEKAGYYYDLGFKELSLYAAHGLPLTGNRLKLMETLVAYLRERPSTQPTATYLPHESHFEFALGKTWRKIVDIFHYNLVLFHFRYTGRGEKLIAHLDMPTTTFYSLRDRLSKRGFRFPTKRQKDFVFNPEHYQEGLQQYLQFEADKTWKEVNKQFERDLMQYLYAAYGYRKTRLSEILDLSYPMVIAKTKAVTDESNKYETFKRD
ncbi:MAG: hypothetical protein K9N11_01870 [Lentisphaeria bacterium]|nr:hypothetical protein [Candidatus Neomarinimicrobiota bacterium]MCF7841576.1 hypothetical protein [Lentisphaeria bacterium]